MLALYILIVVLFLAGAYCAGYLYVRHNHWMIHRSGYAFGNTAQHHIALADPGHSPHPPEVAVAWYLFTPLRYIETAYWYWRYPTDEPWPYFYGDDG